MRRERAADPEVATTIVEETPRASDQPPIPKTVVEHIGAGVGKQARTTEPAAKPIPFRPLKRRPMALLTILDDGCRDSGEVVRLHDKRCLIGRTRGEIVIPHDKEMSSKHAEIRCRRAEGAYQWYLTDLNSTNGTFVRVHKTILRHDTQLLLGNGRYVFEIGQDVSTPPTTPVSDRETSGCRVEQPPVAGMDPVYPRLVQSLKSGEKRVFLLDREEIWIGSDPTTCQFVISGDAFVSRRHARVYRDREHGWTISDADSLNGIWVRIDRMTLVGTTEFQLGEQRFEFRFPFSTNHEPKVE